MLMKTERPTRLVAVAAQLSVLVLVAVLETPCTAQNTNDCPYRYTEQPLENVGCNPYIQEELITSCVVEYGPRQGAVDIMWAFQPLSVANTTRILASSEKYIITPTRSPSQDSSQLQVNSLNESDAGSYACFIRFANDSISTPSQVLDLFAPGVFSVLQLGACTGNDTQPELVEECVTLFVPPPPPPPTQASPPPTQASPPMITTSHGIRSTMAGTLGPITAFILLFVQ